MTARLLMADVDRDPEAVIREAARLVSAARLNSLPTELLVVLRALGIALRMVGRVTEALATFDEGVAEARHIGDIAGEALIRTSRSAALFMSGRMDEGVGDLDYALAHLTDGDKGVALFQRAQYLDVVDDPRAVDAFDEALTLVGDFVGYEKYVGHVLANRGLHHANHGRLVDADADLSAALAAWSAAGLTALAAAATHNLGLVASYRGDYTAALDYYERAQQASVGLGNDHSSAGRDYCETLLAVGLAAEAELRATEFAAEATAAGNVLDSSELALIAAHSAFQLGALDRARSHAVRAAEGLSRLGRSAYVAQARLVAARVDLELDGPTGALQSRVADLAVELENHHQSDAALAARLLGVEALTRGNDIQAGRNELASLGTELKGARLERRLHATTVEAQLAVAVDDARGARRAVSRGIALVDEGMRLVGALDVRAHVPTQAKTLFDVGRRLAWQATNPRRALVGMERLRGLSYRYPPVRPPDDEVLTSLLGELRRLTGERAALDDPVELGVLDAAERRLRRRIADHARRAAGRDQTDTALDIDIVRDQLGTTELITLHDVDDRLVGIHVGRRLRRFEASSTADARDRSKAAQMLLRRLSRHSTNEASRQAATHELAAIARWFDERLLGPLRTDAPVVLVVPSTLAGVPWGLLGRLRDRPYVLASSVAAWSMAAQRRSKHGGTLLVAGPRLRHSSAEVGQLSSVAKAPIVLQGKDATVDGVLRSLPESAVAHIAAHYTPRAGHPMFSSIALTDGPLYLHDLILAKAVPTTWVLPACESAAGDAPAVGELLGLSSALLSVGAGTLVAASGLVPDDDVTTEMMMVFHRHLAAGQRPAMALMHARQAIAGALTSSSLALRATVDCLGWG
jgi:tetratricopeptide (TPR) repeat protein